MRKCLNIRIFALSPPDVFDQIIGKIIMFATSLAEIPFQCSPLAFNSLSVGSIIGDEFLGVVDRPVLVSYTVEANVSSPTIRMDDTA